MNNRFAILPLLLASSLVAQVQPRPSQGPLDTTSTGFGILPSIASDGDLTAIAYTDGGTGGSDTINIVTSDGRGTNWSAPLRVDQGPIGVTKLTQFDACQIQGNNVWVAWEDDRSPTNGRFDMYLARSTNGGATFLPEQFLDKGTPAGTGSVRDWRFIAANAVDVYLLVSIDPTGSADEELYLLASHDGGATFAPPLRVDTTPDDVDQIALAVDQANPLIVHIAYSDDRGGNASNDDIFVVSSLDGGATLTTEQQIDASGPLVGDVENNIEVRADGPFVGVAWLEELGLPSSNEEVRFALSLDGGVTFAPDVQVGTYTGGGVDDVDSFDLGLFGGTFYLSWDDNRTGSDSLYVSSAPGGTGWRPDVVVAAADGGFPAITGDPNGSLVGVVCTSDFDGSPEGCQAAFSDDLGLTWTTEQQYTDQPGNDADFAEVAYNATYRNFISTWLSNTGNPPASATANRIYVGGFRPQTCAPVGWDDIYNPASTTLSFDLRHFGGDTLAIIGLSAGTGPLTASDGRLFDLGPMIAPFGGPGFEATLVGGAGSTLALPNIFAGLGPAVGLDVFYGAAGFSGGVSNLTDTFSFQL